MKKNLQKKAKTNQLWFLPNKPEEDEEGNSFWIPIVRIGKHVPFGYRQDPDDEDILLPIEEELELLEKAKIYLRTYSYRQVAAWLSNESGRYISHEGLRKRVNVERSRKAAAARSLAYARRAQEAADKAAKIQGRIGGRTVYDQFIKKEDRDSPGDSDTGED
jgi:hypothetical protein